MQNIQWDLPVLGVEGHHQGPAETLDYLVWWVVRNGSNLQHWIAPGVQEQDFLQGCTH